MPYNNAPISPSDEITGSSALPLARVKKIIAQDDEIAQCSNSAAFAISVATEIFVRYLTEQAQVVVKSERKPRRNIAYKDIATAISRIDNLEFLSDVVPKTKTYRQIKEDKAREEAAEAAKAAKLPPNGTNGDFSSLPIDQMLQQKPEQINGHQLNGHNILNRSSPERSSPERLPTQRIVAVVQNGQSNPYRNHDVEMLG